MLLLCFCYAVACYKTNPSYTFIVVKTKSSWSLTSIRLDWSKELNKVQRLKALGPLCLWQCLYWLPVFHSYVFSRGSSSFLFAISPTLSVIVALCPPAASFCSSDKALGANKSHVLQRKIKIKHFLLILLNRVRLMCLFQKWINAKFLKLF